MGWGQGYGWTGFGGIFMLVFWLVVIVGAIALVRWLTARGDAGGGAERRRPLEIAQERYARGEISREEYEQLRRDLAG